MSFKNFLLLLLAVLPIAGGATVWLDTVKQNPLGALLLASVYAVGVFVVGLGKDVWTTFRAEIVAAIADWIKMHFLNMTSRFRRRYNKQVRIDHSTFNVKGLRTPGEYTLDLDKVYVELRIVPNTSQHSAFDLIAAKELTGSLPIWDFVRRQVQQEALALAIIGPPGSGKTTLLQHIALTLAANKQRRYRLRAYVPLLLSITPVPELAPPPAPAPVHTTSLLRH